jgi:predicted dinucleotide-binding enzyme
MATLGLIGSGNIGGTLARLAADAGLDVVRSTETVPQEPLVGKTVIDTGNYYAPRDGIIPELELISLLGYDAVDMGPLTESWRSRLGNPAFCAPYTVTKDDQYWTQPAAPASAAEVCAALAAARR